MFELCHAVRTRFAPYLCGDYFMFVEHKPSVLCVQYNTGLTGVRSLDVERAFFALQWEPANRMLYILEFGIPEKHRRKGHGRTLFNLIEETALKNGVRGIGLGASGQGVQFWPEMGFQPVPDNEHAMFKRI